MKAVLKNYRQSPRKVRLVADLIKGKKADYALEMLRYVNKRAAGQMRKVLQSAIANAKDKTGAHPQELTVKNVRVDEGVTLKRFQPKWRGTAHPIRKRTSRIQLELIGKGGTVISSSVASKTKSAKAIKSTKATGKTTAAKKASNTTKTTKKSTSK